MASSIASRLARLRPYALTAVLLAALATFYLVTRAHQPIGTWVFWRYAGYWLACCLWGVGCLSTGLEIVARLLPGKLPLREQLATSFALGVFVYYLLGSTLGLFHVFGGVYFAAVPVVMFAVGSRRLWSATRRLVRHVRHARRTFARPAPWTVWPVVAFGLLGLGMIYFTLMTPHNVAFDSRWKHMALAEQYAATGGIRRFPEGWTVATNPHLATFVYLFAFMLPVGQLFDRVELAAHLEFTVFIVTTLSIGPLARRLVPGCTTRHLWVARFLFPGVYLYDSNLSGGADHIAALFTVPMFLLLLRASRDLDWRHLSLATVMMAGAVMTKLTGLLMFMPVMGIVVAFRGGTLLLQRRHSRVEILRGPMIALGVGLAVTSTFWLKNWIWYGDPLYPSLHKYLTPRPWTEDSAHLFEWGYKDRLMRPTRDLAGVSKTLAALFNFSFIPNDYPRYHGKVPVIGSLFTLLLPVLMFFARKAKRAWGLVASVHVAVFIWYWVHHEDRYLQALMPWMAAVSAAAIVLAWRSGWLPRVAVSLLVAFQIAWGSDVYFIPTHAMAGSPIKRTVDFLAGTYKKDKTRLETYPQWVALGKKLPKGSRVLLHDNHIHLGVAASTVSDWNGWQYGMSYARHPTIASTYDLMRDMGVTHIVIENNKSAGWDSIAGDVLFFNFAKRATVDHQRSGPFFIAKMPDSPPEGLDVSRVLYLGCGKPVANGLYPLSSLSVSVFGPGSETYPAPEKTGKPEDLLRDADAVVLESKCQAKPPGGRKFELAGKRKGIKHFKRAKELTIWFPAEDANLMVPVEDDAPDSRDDDDLDDPSLPTDPDEE